MAALRQARKALFRDNPTPDLELNVPDSGSVSTPGGTPGGMPREEGNPMKPIEFNPGETPRRGRTARTPTQSPEVNAGPVDRQVFGGGGSTTLTPPSVTQSLPAPTTDSMVFPRQQGGGRLFGNRGGQFGGGLSLGASELSQEAEDPSALILSLLQMLG